MPSLCGRRRARQGPLAFAHGRRVRGDINPCVCPLMCGALVPCWLRTAAGDACGLRVTACGAAGASVVAAPHAGGHSRNHRTGRGAQPSNMSPHSWGQPRLRRFNGAELVGPRMCCSQQARGVPQPGVRAARVPHALQPLMCARACARLGMRAGACHGRCAQPATVMTAWWVYVARPLPIQLLVLAVLYTTS